MRYKIDHDYHIHSQLSSCSGHAEQTAGRILQYAEENGLSRVCLTDHYWDSAVPGASVWYKPQDFEHISAALPLPSHGGIDFLFGCETDMDKHFTLGIPEKRFSDFSFIIVPTTHLHMTGFTISDEDAESYARRAELWVKRLDALFDMSLPFRKLGIAHPVCNLIHRKSREEFLLILDMIPSDDMERIFSRAAELGAGIELNMSDMRYRDSERDTVLRPFRIAKSCGCKFYLGSDAHKPNEFSCFYETMERAITDLELRESDKFHISDL